MKTYTVELKRTSYITMTIEAENADQAEQIAWERVNNELDSHADATWEKNYIEEITA